MIYLQLIVCREKSKCEVKKMKKRNLNRCCNRVTIAISVTLKWPLRNTSDINLATGIVRLLQNLGADANKQAISLPNIFFYPLCSFSFLSAEILARKGYYQLCKTRPLLAKTFALRQNSGRSEMEISNWKISLANFSDRRVMSTWINAQAVVIWVSGHRARQKIKKYMIIEYRRIVCRWIKKNEKYIYFAMVLILNKVQEPLQLEGYFFLQNILNYDGEYDLLWW